MSHIPDRPILSIYRLNSSNQTRDLRILTEKLLDTACLEEMLPKNRKSRIGIKPNLVVARPAHEGATTHPDIAAGVIIYLKKRGYHNLVILEGSWVGDSTVKAFSKCGYTNLSLEFNVQLFDTQKDSVITRKIEDYKLSICSVMETIDYLINLPVLKGHCQTRYTGALKNLKGCIPDSEKRRYHSNGLHEPIARLNQLISQDFIVMDGICGDPTFEEGGSPSSMNRILCSADPVLLDSYGAALLGYTPDEIPYLTKSSALGTGNLWDGDESAVLEVNSHEGSASVDPDPELARLKQRIDDREACSSCYAALISALRQKGQAADPIEGIQSIEGIQYAVGRYFRSGELPGHASHSIGIGTCTSRFPRSVPGCPPTPEQIKKRVF